MIKCWKNILVLLLKNIDRTVIWNPSSKTYIRRNMTRDKKGDLASRVKKLLTPGTVLERPALLGERKEASCLSGPAWLMAARCLYHLQLCSLAINCMGVQYFFSQVIVERASRDDAGMYECWDTNGEAASKTKQVQRFPLMTETKKYYQRWR